MFMYVINEFTYDCVLQEDLESHVPLFADHESISELLEGSSVFGGSSGVQAEGQDTPRTRTRFMSLDVTGSSPSPFLRRSLSNPKRSKPKGKKVFRYFFYKNL